MQSEALELLDDSSKCVRAEGLLKLMDSSVQSGFLPGMDGCSLTFSSSHEGRSLLDHARTGSRVPPKVELSS